MLVRIKGVPAVLFRQQVLESTIIINQSIMKKSILLCLCVLFAGLAKAQLYIDQNAQMHMKGNSLVTLTNSDFLNNGNFFPGLGTVVFNGPGNAVLGGSHSSAIHNIEINKTGGARLIMQQVINVTDTVLFSNGNIDLNGQILDLGMSAKLIGEKESSRITGNNGGYVVVSATLSSPVNANPGNLGALITSSSNLGNVLIRRGHKSQQNSYGMGNSVLRYYDIIPTNNNNLDATLQFRYFDSELNGLNESSLEFWSSTDYLHWKNEYYSLGNINLNYWEKQGIGYFPIRWTLSNANNPLPVTFSFFNLQCTGDAVLLRWQTAQEQNSDHFRIERSTNTVDWVEAGRITAAGNTNTGRSYSFTDKQPAVNSYYRIVQVDRDGKTIATNIVRSTCSLEESIKAWPNPFRDRIHVDLSLVKATPVSLILHDNNGRLMKSQHQRLPAGNSHVTIETVELSKGSYWLTIYTGNGEKAGTFQLIRQ